MNAALIATVIVLAIVAIGVVVAVKPASGRESLIRVGSRTIPQVKLTTVDPWGGPATLYLTKSGVNSTIALSPKDSGQTWQYAFVGSLVTITSSLGGCLVGSATGSPLTIQPTCMSPNSQWGLVPMKTFTYLLPGGGAPTTATGAQKLLANKVLGFLSWVKSPSGGPSTLAFTQATTYGGNPAQPALFIDCYPTNGFCAPLS